jgi:type IV pilus assembly protein PilB
MKKLLGELLIENRLITQEQLDEALKIQRKDGDLLGAILVNLGYLDDETLLDYLKMQGARIKMHDKN